MDIHDRLGLLELERELFEDFGELNRDWRRIAETEVNTNFNNGYLTTELSLAPEGEPTYMIGVSSPNACDWCLDNVRNNVVLLLAGPPVSGSDDVVISNGETITAIWPGKTNAGLSKDQWWVAAGTQHPHCRCTWTPWMEGADELEQEIVGNA